MRHQPGFDLAQLDAQASDLHLIIVAAQVLQGAIRQIAHQVTGAVQPRLRPSVEWIRQESLGCQFVTVQIPSRHALTADVKLTDAACRHQLGMGVEHVQLKVADRPTQGDIAGRVDAEIGSHPVPARHVTAFGGAIAVDEQRTRLRQFLQLCQLDRFSTLRSILGIICPRQGQIHFNGQPLVGQKIFEIARQGLALVPENRGIFRLLTVEENLRIAVRKTSRWQMEDVYGMFPRLKERRKNAGHALSGGEQQMLAIARALLNDPKLLILDEPTEGLAPVIVDELVKILRKVKEDGLPVLLVEQNLMVCDKLADRHYVLEQGRVVYEGSAEAFRADPTIKNRYLALSA